MNKTHGFTWLIVICITGLLSFSWSSHGASIEEHLQFSGFGRLVADTLDTDQAKFKEYDDDMSWRPHTLLGGQVNYQMIDGLSATAQAVLRASDSQDSDLEWLFLTWVADESLVFRLGRQRGPFFLYSDSIDIGYSRPAINLPYQMYSGYIFPTFDGLDVTWSFSDETFQYTLEGYAGSYGGGDLNIYGGTTDYELKEVAGIIGKIKYSSVEFRLSLYRGYPSLIVPEIEAFAQVLEQAGFAKTADALKTEGVGYITQLGLMVDELNYFLTAEYMVSSSEIKYTVPVLETYYIGGGFYSGNFTYHATYSVSETSYSTFEQEIPLGVNAQLDQLYYGVDDFFSRLTEDDLKTLNLGVRWDIHPNVALKADAMFLYGEKDQTSFFTIEPAEFDKFDRKSVLYLFAVDWVF